MTELPESKCVLVIDDHEDVRSLVTDILRDHGHAVVEAPNGKLGYDLAFRYKPDLVITDLIMPEQEGIETIRALRKLTPHLKILAMSGCADTVHLRTARLLGADDALRKPFSCEALLHAVYRLLQTPGEDMQGGSALK